MSLESKDLSVYSCSDVIAADSDDCPMYRLELPVVVVKLCSVRCVGVE